MNNKVKIEFEKISFNRIQESFNKLMELYKDRILILHVPDSNNNIDHTISFISEIFSYVQLLYKGILNEMGFKKPVSLIDMYYDKKNRQGFDHLFLDLEQGEIIIGEVKSSVISDFKNNYTNNLNSYKKSLKDNKTISIRQKTINEVLYKTQKGNFLFFNIPLIDDYNLKMSDEAINNFRSGIKSILFGYNSKEKTTQFKDYEHISFLATFWNGINENYSYFNEEFIKSYFNKEVIQKFYPKVFNYVLVSELSNDEYLNLYNDFLTSFEKEYKLFLNNEFSNEIITTNI